ncbi:DegT/DnrJ/EryC1/StrS family aminotransferase [Streptomyces sp. NPDC021093]|uniref:DegT/DnrJ/EryC1/StrS family aminotransferase n=1 Tax=Streptomyces sp. NPDC021093 TaxID=3365112 RepID=UPI00379475AB
MSSETTVPFYSWARAARRDWPRLEKRLESVLHRGEFTAGQAVAELEEGIARYTGAGFAVGCNNGSDALAIMLRAAGIGPGDEVIVPAYTFFSSASSVIHVGAEPVLVDIQPGSYALDPEAVERAITSRTRAIMPVHLFSQMADMVALTKVAADHGLTVLEDSAEAIGMRVQGRHAGLWGRAGVLSFFPTKTLGALGDAGMLLTDDEELARSARMLTVHGRSPDGTRAHELIGWNSRLDEIQACVLLTRLERLEEEIERRAVLAARYTEGLSGIDEVQVPWLRPTVQPGNQVWYVYLAECQRRDELVEFLETRGVGTEVYYPRPLTQQPVLAGRPGVRHPVPVAEASARRAVGLPMYPDLTEAQVDHVVDAVRAFYRGASS